MITELQLKQIQPGDKIRSTVMPEYVETVDHTEGGKLYLVTTTIPRLSPPTRLVVTDLSLWELVA